MEEEKEVERMKEIVKEFGEKVLSDLHGPAVITAAAVGFAAITVKGLREVGMDEAADRAVLSFLASSGDISDGLRVVSLLTRKMSEKMSGDMWEVLLDEDEIVRAISEWKTRIGGDERCEQG